LANLLFCWQQNQHFAWLPPPKLKHPTPKDWLWKILKNVIFGFSIGKTRHFWVQSCPIFGGCLHSTFLVLAWHLQQVPAAQHQQGQDHVIRKLRGSDHTEWSCWDVNNEITW
jgi:hypothetical protein